MSRVTGPEKLAFSPGQAATALGLSKKSVYRLMWTGKIPAFQPNGPGGRWLIPIAAVRTWLDEEQRAAAATRAPKEAAHA